MEIKNPDHKHMLILNEDYIARDGDVCLRCNEEIFSCKSFVYSCSHSNTGSTNTSTGVDEMCAKFLLHKTCAELPPTIRYPTNHDESLVLRSEPTSSYTFSLVAADGRRPTCYICGIPWRWFSYCRYRGLFYICIKCVISHIHSFEDRNLDHPSHPQHTLTLVQRPSSFKCDACKANDSNGDLSYICTRCPFWMHKSCAHAPTSFQFHFHDKHPLILSFSLPEIYHKFDQYCRLCNDSVGRLNWLYYCPRCRYFSHFQCARSSRMLSSSENDDSDLVHLPALDESSVNLLFEKFVKDTSAINSNNQHNGNFSAINDINHCTHDEHHLQLITISEFNDQKDDDEMFLVCDSCVKPIRTDNNLFYACVPCKYYLHKFCAELMKEIKHHLWPRRTLLAKKLSAPYKFFDCDSCRLPSNGIFFCRTGIIMRNDVITNIGRFHIGCVTLPKMLKHEAHHHKLNQIYTGFCVYCRACGQFNGGCKHGCKECD